MSLSVSSTQVVAVGREKLLDLRDFVVISYYRLRAVPHAGRAAMAGLVLVGALGGGVAAVRHHFRHQPTTLVAVTPPEVANVAPAAVVAAVDVPAVPTPTPVAETPAATPKFDMRATGAVSPVDDPVKKKKKKKSKDHKNVLDSKR